MLRTFDLPPLQGSFAAQADSVHGRGSCTHILQLRYASMGILIDLLLIQLQYMIYLS